MFFGLVACASYGIGYNVTRRKLYGFVAVVLVCFAGFISGVFQLSTFVFQHDLAGHSATGAHSFLDWLLHIRCKRWSYTSYWKPVPLCWFSSGRFACTYDDSPLSAYVHHAYVLAAKER